MKISVILNAHSETNIVIHTIRSVVENIEALRRQNYACELIVVADLPTAGLLSSLERAREEYSFYLECVDFGDLGESRNFGVTISKGEYIAFVDADDVWGSNWLLSALKLAEAETNTIWHPEVSYYFGYSLSRTSSIVSRHISSDSHEFDPVTLFSGNFWTSACFAHRGIFETIPYKPADRKRRFGYEDWAFNIDSLAAGYTHRMVPETVHFIRNKPQSTMRDAHTAFSAVPNSPVLVDLISSSLHREQLDSHL